MLFDLLALFRWLEGGFLKSPKSKIGSGDEFSTLDGPDSGPPTPH